MGRTPQASQPQRRSQSSPSKQTTTRRPSPRPQPQDKVEPKKGRKATLLSKEHGRPRASARSSRGDPPLPLPVSSSSSSSTPSEAAQNVEWVMDVDGTQGDPVVDEIRRKSLPTLGQIAAAPWATLEFVPSEVREEWTAILTECLTEAVYKPTTASLTRLFMASKLLLAVPRRGGRARMDALCRLLRIRFSLWKAGHYDTLWDRVSREHPPRERRLGEPARANFKKIARLVDEGQLSRAASCVCSEGPLDPYPELLRQVEDFFPPVPAEVLHPAEPHRPMLARRLAKDALDLTEPGCPRRRRRHPWQPQ